MARTTRTTRTTLRVEPLEDRTTPTTFSFREAAGTNAATIQSAVDAFRADLGTLNANTAGSVGSGRREINWDGVPDALASPNALPGNFFNTTSPRGVVFLAPGGNVFQVSATAAVGNVRFDNINSNYSTNFSAFSAQRLFTAIGSNVTDVTFFIPGSNTPASVNGFGAVFTDVDRADITKLEFFTANNVLLFTRNVLSTASIQQEGGLSFLGAKADTGTPIARVRITAGAFQLGTDDVQAGGTDKVVMDDFIYGEPIVAPLGGSISGIAFNDLNGDGVKQTNEPVLVGQRIFEDSTGDNDFDVVETNTLTAADGSWTLSFVGDGARRIRIDRPGGFINTSAVPTFVPIFGGSTDTLDFGVRDTTPPVVQSVTRLDRNPTNAAQVRFQVKFSIPVTGFDATDLTPTSGGGLGAGSIAGITGSGDTYTVTANIPGGPNDGTFKLLVADDNSITDAFGTPLGGPTAGDGNFNGGENYTIDRVAPTVTITRTVTQADPTDGTTVAFTAVFSEPVTGFTAASVSLAGSTTTGAVGISGSGTTYTVTVSGIAAAGTITATIPAGAASDAAGNASLAAAGRAPTVTVVTPPPVNGDRFAVATGPGTPVRVKVFTPDGTERFTLAPFGTFAGGATVATGDVTGDGIDDVVVGAGPGAAPHVKVFDGVTGAELQSFFAFAVTFTGGVFVGAGDVTGDGFADVVVGAGAGAGPHVKVFDGRNGDEVRSFFAFAKSFAGGVSVRADDIDGDGAADIVAGAGPGGAPHVRVFSGATGDELQSFFAGPADDRAGVLVGVGNFDPASNRPEIVASVGGRVRVFGPPAGNAAALLPYIEQDSFVPFAVGTQAAPAAIRLGDGSVAVLVGAAGQGGPRVLIRDGTSNTVRKSFFAFDEALPGGVAVG